MKYITKKHIAKELQKRIISSFNRRILWYISTGYLKRLKEFGYIIDSKGKEFEDGFY